jgi:DNA-binding CsgD family transcriptional regulator
METLSSADIRLLNQSIQQLYALLDRPSFGVEALAIVHQLVPSEVPLFQQTDTRTHAVAATFLPGHGWASPENLRLMDMVQSGFILNRDRRSFSERDRLILNLLRPHLFQAYGNVQRYAQITQDLNQLQRSVSHLGLINCDRHGRMEEPTAAGFDALAKLGLSQRETAVLDFLMQGKDNKTIALAMAVHVGTVRKHLENIYRKLNVHSRTEAVSAALAQLGLYERPSP